MLVQPHSDSTVSSSRNCTARHCSCAKYPFGASVSVVSTCCRRQADPVTQETLYAWFYLVTTINRCKLHTLDEVGRGRATAASGDVTPLTSPVAASVACLGHSELPVVPVSSMCAGSRSNMQWCYRDGKKVSYTSMITSGTRANRDGGTGGSLILGISTNHTQ